MSLWWLQPGWQDATCPFCGRNIWQAGGDPDMGECFDCYTERYGEPEHPEPEGPLCDICGEDPAVAGSNGYGVCSAACDYEALSMAPKTPEPTQ